MTSAILRTHSWQTTVHFPEKMAPHGKQMTPEEKQIIVALSQQGYSSYTIAEMTGKNRRTISKFLRRRRVRGSEENLPRSGRGRKTGVRGDRIMYGMLLSDRRQSLGEITDQFNRQFVTKISSRTVRRRLYFEGYKKHPVCKKTCRLLRNLLIVLLFLSVISAIV
jgi:transposase